MFGFTQEMAKILNRVGWGRGGVENDELKLFIVNEYLQQLEIISIKKE